MEVIQFPKDKDRYRDGTPSPEKRLCVGSFSYTCVCGNKSTVEPQNLIFRSMEFYCPKCGTCHKITNPAFTPSAPKSTSR